MTVPSEFGWQPRAPSGSGSETIAQITPLRRTGGPLNHAVYDVLRERLLEGRYPAGTRLPTDDLRAELGVSKQPVMEALRRLAADGMVQIVPQVGCLVTGYDLHEVEDFYLAFGGFEGGIAGTAALRRTDEQLAELDEISRHIDALRGERDAAARSRGYRLWNRRFHHAIGAMAQSRMMTETSRRMWNLSDFLINTAGLPQPLSSALDDRHADHERIRAALHAGDHAVAREEMERHIVTTAAVIQCESESARHGVAPELPREERSGVRRRLDGSSSVNS
jgi:DNA-binding GntR family transcriptional regulator